MTLRFFVRSISSASPRRRAALALCVLAATVACAPKSTPPTTVATPPTAAASAVMQTCPDPSDGPSIVINAVDEAHRTLVANPSTPLPPVCVLAAFARLTTPVPDSLNADALALTGELRRRGGSDQRQLLATEVVLFARMRRYADVSAAYDKLAAIDSQPAIEVSRLAIAAAHQRGDTAKLIRLLARNSSRPGAGASVAGELNVLRQIGALRSAIDEARGLVRQNPKIVTAYPSLVGNFGTLGVADSVVAYIRRALAQGATRATLSVPVETFVTTSLRRAALYGSTYGWDAQIAAATRVDSALSTPSTKFLLASLIIQSTEPPIAEISSRVSGALSPGSADAASRPQAEQRRTAACQRVAPLTQLLNVAQSHLRNGGDRYAGGGVSQLNGGLVAGQSTLATLEAKCAQSR